MPRFAVKKHKVILRVDLKRALFSRSQKRSHGRAESAPHSVPGLALDFVFILSIRLNRKLLKSNDDGNVKRMAIKTTTLHMHHAFLYILRLKETVIAWQSFEVISLFSFLSPLKSTDCGSIAEEHSLQYSRFTAPCLRTSNRKTNSIASLSCW